MRMIDVLQFLKTFTSNVKVKGKLPGFEMELDGKGILDLHANSIWLSHVICEGFLKPRIMWEDFRHEFRFFETAKRGVVCKASLLRAATAIQEARTQVPGKTAAEFKIIDLLVAIESTVDVAARSVIESLEEYNKYVLATGGDSDEKMSDEDHLQSLFGIVRSVRLTTYPSWYSLIDLLPEGATRTQAENTLKSGCQTVGLDTIDITPDWHVTRAQIN